MRSRVVRGAGAAAIAIFAWVGAVSPPVAGPAGAPPSAAGPAGRYIVRAVPGALPTVLRDLKRRGLPAGPPLLTIDAVTVSVPAGLAGQLRADPRIASVTPDAAVSLLSKKDDTAYNPKDDDSSLYNLEEMVGVRKQWKSSTGAGVDVALVDSGVTPVAGLSEPGKLVQGPDLTPEAQSASTAHLDGYGHGTHLAGIIAGHDSGVDPVADRNDPGPFLGVAPGARIISVKVADEQGSSDVSQVIAGIDWVVQHAHDPGLDIRVLNLSFGTDSAQSYTLDPLAYAVEVAWQRGIVVVTSAGNSGTEDGRLTDPAIDPFVIAVGADDLNKTKGVNNDTIPDFSSRGNALRSPDLVAPGVHVQSLRVPGSTVDTLYASTGAIDARFFRGSGTSQAAAFVSGCAAVLLGQSPDLTPDQVKAALTRAARALPAESAQAQGNGLVNLAGVRVPADAALQTWPPSTGTGSLEAARGDTSGPTGDLDGHRWGSSAWAGDAWN